MRSRAVSENMLRQLDSGIKPLLITECINLIVAIYTSLRPFLESKDC